MSVKRSRHVRTSHLCLTLAVFAACGNFASADIVSLTTPSTPIYTVKAVGLYDAGGSNAPVYHTVSLDSSGHGIHVESISAISDNGSAIGTATAYLPTASIPSSGTKLVTSDGTSAWYYNSATSTTSQILLTNTSGFTYTGTNGLSQYNLSGINKSGTAAGYAAHYTSGGTLAGFTPYTYGPSGITNIAYNDPTSGYTGLLHSVVPSGASYTYQNESATAINNSGQVIGVVSTYSNTSGAVISSQYTGNGGSEVYLYTPGSGSKIIDTLDANHEPGKAPIISANTLNDAGYVAGTAVFTNNLTNNYSSVFQYRPTTTGGVYSYVDIGAITGIKNGGSSTTDGYTQSDGVTQSATLVAMNASGQVIGTNVLYTGTKAASPKTSTNNYVELTNGSTGWLYTPPTGTATTGTAVEVGIGSFGTGATNPTARNAFVSGSDFALSNGNTFLTTVAGVASYTGTTLSTTAAAGHLKDTTLRAINANGQVLGTSVLYTSTTNDTSLGNVGFIYKPASGTKAASYSIIGLTHNGTYTYQTSAGTINTVVNFINGSGQAVGNSTFYNSGGTSLGTQAWFFDPNDKTDANGTKLIGLTDATHTATYAGSSITAGAQASTIITSPSTVSFLNSSGLVAGSSKRYFNNSANSTSYAAGADAWVYNNGTTYQFTLSTGTVGSATNYANSVITYLGDDGTVLGYFEKFNSSGGDLGITEAFKGTFTSSGYTLYDLGASSTTSLSSGQALVTATKVSANGAYIGGGGLLDTTYPYSQSPTTSLPQNIEAYLLSGPADAPLVPEPASVSLLLVGAAGLLTLRRRAAL